MNIFKIFDQIKKNKDKTKIEKIVVGLGNFSPKYENTRHNAGFEALDLILKNYNITLERKKFQSLFNDGYIENIRCLFLKPLTFMNNSGDAVEAFRDFYKIKTKDIIVLYDDISFEPGKIKIKKKGSSGGHNGIKSIIYQTGEDDFLRIKLGVGKKPNKEYDLAKWVLSKFSAKEKEDMKKAYETALKAIKLIVSGKIEEAMNKYN